MNSRQNRKAEVLNILKGSKAPADSLYASHLSMDSPQGTFIIGKVKQNELWDSYCALVEITEGNTGMSILEKSLPELPILVDVDLKVQIQSESEMDNYTFYTIDDIKTVIRIYQDVIKTIVDECTINHLICVVLEKDKYIKDGYLKHGFHLHFPYCFLDKQVHINHLIPRVKDELDKTDLFQSIGVEQAGSVIDKSYTSNPWLIYGSAKKANMQPYLMTMIFDYEQKEISVTDAFSQYEIFNDKGETIYIRNNVEYYLPRILSIIPNERPVSQIKTSVLSPLVVKLKTEKKQYEEIVSSITVRETLDQARQLIKFLAPFRYTEYSEWIHMGWLLYNISNGSQEGFVIWDEFSQLAGGSYDAESCVDRWSKMVVQDTPTIGTLKFYAKKDSPDKYSEYNKSQITKRMDNTLMEKATHYRIAKLLHMELADEFVCASVSSKLWFQFINHRWKLVDDGVYIRKKITEMIGKLYEDKSEELRLKQLEQGVDPITLMYAKNTKSIVDATIANLQTNPWKSGVMKEAMDLFYDEKFQPKLNANKYIIAFQNGVYDLQNNVFRNGKPEDYLSIAMKVSYKQFTMDDPKVKLIESIFQKIFPDKSLYRYFFDTSSDIFVGGNMHKVVHFWTGEGDNGKSITQFFFDNMLGPLGIKLNTTVITGKKPPSGAANADLARTGGGVRLCVFEESSPDEEINIGILKHLSGNDTFYARDLFERGKDGREIEPMFKLVFISNKLPILRYADTATFNRVRVLPFESTFRGKNHKFPPPEDEAEQFRVKIFPIDKTLKDQIPDLVEAFAWYLLEWRKRILNEPRIEPPKVLEATEHYKQANDFYRKYIDENIIKTETNETLSVTEVYSSFKEWFKESMPNRTVVNKCDFSEIFVRLWGPFTVRPNGWKGYKIRSMEDTYDVDNEGTAWPIPSSVNPL
jgi:P4 family phage/plasmid primase-like protien